MYSPLLRRHAPSLKGMGTCKTEKHSRLKLFLPHSQLIINGGIECRIWVLIIILKEIIPGLIHIILFLFIFLGKMDFVGRL